MGDEKHTPLLEEGSNIFFPSGHGFYVADKGARIFIVKACNSHAHQQEVIKGLVGACERVMLRRPIGGIAENIWLEDEDVELIEAALKLAKEKS